jgi:hypothetical protein
LHQWADRPPMVGTMDRENQGRIWAIAHEIWELEGRPDGQSARHWKMARAQIARGQSEPRDQSRGGLASATG